MDKLSEFDKDIVTRDIRRPPSRARLVGLFGAGAGQVHSLKGEKVILGRGTESGIVIESLEVSREHAKIWRGKGDHWFVQDFDSSNGTYINGLALRGAQEIQFGDRLQLARDTLFVFTHHDLLEDQVLQLQKMDALGQLAGEVAHDFKNLLTVFSATVDMWRMRRARGHLKVDGPFTDERLDQDLQRMDETSARANELIQRLLGYARPSKGEEGPVNISEVVQEAVNLCTETFPERITIETSLLSGKRIPGDATQIHQVVMNLLVNARDAMPAGGTINVGVEHLRQDEVEGLDSQMTPRGFVCISVADTGMGMERSVREHIFDPFFTTKDKGKGTGLGLATVNAIAARHDGQVLVESEPGLGATFRIFLPTWRPTSDPKSQEPIKTEEIQPINFKDTHVLSRKDMVVATSTSQWEEDLTVRSHEEE